MSIENIQTIYNKLKRHILPIAFIFGFIFDYLTLTRIDRLYDNLVLSSYIIIAATGIIIIHAELTSKIWGYLTKFAPTVIQFAFGGLFSGFLIFYSRSASLIASWPFLLLLLAMMIGNEIFKEKYSRLTFQLSIFYFVLFSYLIFLLPILIKKSNSWIFLLSGLASILAIYLFIKTLKKINENKIIKAKKYPTLAIATIFTLINIFYFTNIIPPIPLALKDIGVYYSVEKIAPDKYDFQEISQPWYGFLLIYDRVPLRPGQSVSVFSSVFAPTALETDIVHHWQYHNGEKWVSSSKIKFPIVGGRDGGYRGFSQKTSITPGYWRIDVETSNGLIIGRAKFLVSLN